MLHTYLIHSSSKATTHTGGRNVWDGWFLVFFWAGQNFFLLPSHENQSKFLGYQGWFEILIITCLILTNRNMQVRLILITKNFNSAILIVLIDLGTPALDLITHYVQCIGIGVCAIDCWRIRPLCIHTYIGCLGRGPLQTAP